MKYKYVLQDADGTVREATNEPFPGPVKWIGQCRFRTVVKGKPNHYWENSLIDLSTNDYKLSDGILIAVPIAPKAAGDFELISPYPSGEVKVLLEHPLFPVFMAAIHQAAFGKGERHGGNATPFLEQPWVGLADRHGNGFLTGQCEKKIGEAPSKPHDACNTEILGALVYGGMAYIHHNKKEKK